MWVGLSAIAARVLGLARETFLASGFGTGIRADAFASASVLPMLIVPAIALAGSTVIIPFYTDESRGRIVEGQAVRAFAGLFLLAAFAMLLVPGVVASLVGSPMNLVTRGLEVRYIQYLSVAGLLYGLNIVLTGICQAREEFKTPSRAVLAGSVVTAGMFALSAYTHSFTYILYGIDLGQLAQLAVLSPVLLGTMRVDAGGASTSRVWKTVLARTPSMVAGLTAFQVSLAVDRFLAGSASSVGTLAALRFGDLVGSLPLNILSYATVFVLYPRLALAANAEHRMQINQAGIRLLVFMLIPIAVLTLVLRVSLVTVIFERGAFGQQSLATTSAALGGFAAGIVFFSLWDWMTRERLLSGDQLGVLLVGVLVWIANYAVGRALVPLGAGGISLATSLAFGLGVALLLLRQKRESREPGFGLGKRTGQLSLAVAAALPIWIGASLFPLPLVGLVGALVGLAVFVAAAHLLKIPEEKALRSLLAGGGSSGIG